MMENYFPVPREAMFDSETRVLLAVVAGNLTYTDLVVVTGFSRNTLWRHLHALRTAGLVSFEDKKKGTLQPLVRRVR